MILWGQGLFWLVCVDLYQGKFPRKYIKIIAQFNYMLIKSDLLGTYWFSSYGQNMCIRYHSCHHTARVSLRKRTFTHLTAGRLAIFCISNLCCVHPHSNLTWKFKCQKVEVVGSLSSNQHVIGIEGLSEIPV